jgi:lipopolysaccharide export system permease protein
MIKKFLIIFQFLNTLIGWYINRNLLVIFLAITFIIGMLVFGNQFVLTVKESIERGIPFGELLPIVMINMYRDIPIIVSLSLFLSIIITISQLYKNSEAVVMNSIGIGSKHFFVLIQPLVWVIFFGLLALTTYLIPMAKYEKNIKQEETRNASEFSFITEGQFEEFKDGEIVFFASNSKLNDGSLESPSEQNMQEIFIYSHNNGEPIIVIASEAKKYINSENKGTYLLLKNGVRYQGIPSDKNKKILNFDSYNLEIISGETKDSLTISTEIEATNSIDLIVIGGNYAYAELQWRISQPISILVLTLIGVFLGKTSPRNNKGLNILFGVGVFILYNNALLVFKSLIENGQLNLFIGFIGPHFLILIVILLIYQLEDINFTKYLDKISFFNFKKKNHV